MDILKDMMSNPGLHHVAETIIGYLDRELALELVDKRELLSEEERKFLMETLRRRMFNEAQQICDKTYTSMFGRFTFPPFFIEALQELKTSETLESFKQMGEILLLLEDVTGNDWIHKFMCLNDFIDPEYQDAKGPKDMIKILKKGTDLYRYEIYQAYFGWSSIWRNLTKKRIQNYDLKI